MDKFTQLNHKEMYDVSGGYLFLILLIPLLVQKCEQEK